MLGIPSSTYYDWYARWVEDGIDALADRSPCPRSVWNRITDDVREAFISDNPALWEATEANLKAQAMVQSKGLLLSDQVRATMLEAFSITEPNIAHACGRLRLSRSALLRRLAGEAVTFQSLLDKTRKKSGDPILAQKRPE